MLNCLFSPSWQRLGRKGSISLIMAGSLIPLMVAIGVGVDMSRMTLAKTALQAAVDGAALAGANAYVSPTSQNAAQAASVSYFDTFTQAGSTTTGSRNATAQPGTLSGALSVNNSYNVTVTASAKLPMTFMNIAGYSNLTVTARAVAANPLVQPILSHGIGTTGGVGLDKPRSDAYDWNSAYVYAVPLDGNGDPQWAVLPPSDQIVQISSNCSSTYSSAWSSNSLCNGQPHATFTNKKLPPIMLNQPIAIVLINMTGGVKQYGGNQYSSPDGNLILLSTNLLASNQSPSANGDWDTSIISKIFGQTITKQSTSTTYSQVAGECSLMISQVDPRQTPIEPPHGRCFNLNDQSAGLQFANLSCAQMAGRTFAFWWNDMGGGRDDLDYNDTAFMMTCTLPSTIGTTSTTAGPPVGAPVALLE